MPVLVHYGQLVLMTKRTVTFKDLPATIHARFAALGATACHLVGISCFPWDLGNVDYAETYFQHIRDIFSFIYGQAEMKWFNKNVEVVFPLVSLTYTMRKLEEINTIQFCLDQQQARVMVQYDW